MGLTIRHIDFIGFGTFGVFGVASVAVVVVSSVKLFDFSGALRYAAV